MRQLITAPARFSFFASLIQYSSLVFPAWHTVLTRTMTTINCLCVSMPDTCHQHELSCMHDCRVCILLGCQGTIGKNDYQFTVILVPRSCTSTGTSRLLKAGHPSSTLILTLSQLRNPSYAQTYNRRAPT